MEEIGEYSLKTADSGYLETDRQSEYELKFDISKIGLFVAPGNVPKDARDVKEESRDDSRSKAAKNRLKMVLKDKQDKGKTNPSKTLISYPIR